MRRRFRAEALALKHPWAALAADWALTAFFAPLLVIEDFCLRARTRPFTHGRIEDAWARCCAFWKKSSRVCQHAGHCQAPFQHSLAEALARQHRTKRAFFMRKLLDPDPLPAAYAFKCLIRVCDLKREDMPQEALSREERIPALWADLGSEEPLGDFFEGYFREKEWLAARHSAKQIAAVNTASPPATPP